MKGGLQMRVRSAFAVLGLSASLVLVAGVAPAGAKPALNWQSPTVITSGVPVSVASIDPCPAVPTPSDTLLVEINVLFPHGIGGMGQLVNNPNSDGSWSGTVTFTFSNAPSRATISADCVDFTGHSGTTYAQYRSSKVTLIG